MGRHRRGFIFLVGTKNVISADASAPAAAACPKCGRTGSLAGQQVRPWFTFFLIPLFPIGPARRFTRCRQCGASYAAAPEQFGRAAARRDDQGMRRGIALYNGMRANPRNSVTLNELMNLYLSLGDPAQAIGAAIEFPAAVSASEQCMVTVGRAYAATDDPAAATKWFEQAMARNPDSGEAHAAAAAAYLAAVPVDAKRAVAAARVARRADYPGADELLRRAESAAREET